ncbi:MAG: DUF4159 domain-containing protein [Isosphaeraceae bacterium]
MVRSTRRVVLLATLAAAVVIAATPSLTQGAVTRDQVEQAIRGGVRYLIRQQRDDGSWPDADQRAQTGTTSLVVLALLTAGEKPSSPSVAKAIDFLAQYTAEELHRTYSVALQTMVFATADPQLKRFGLHVANNAAWLEKAQLKANDHFEWPGSWTYTSDKEAPGDNSNTQYALLGLYAASEAGVKVDPKVWALSRAYWEGAQRGDGSWSYMPHDRQPSTASMTCAGISSLIITGLRRFEGLEILLPDGSERNCGKGGLNDNLQRGVDWMAANFKVSQNAGRQDSLWKFYYLYGLERAGRLTGLRYFGANVDTGRANDWYRLGAEHLVESRDTLVGYWSGGVATEANPLVSTSFALLYLAKGRSPVVVNKLRHGPGDDWDNDHDDVRNLVNAVSRDWNHLLTWQTVDPGTASVEDLLQAPILYFNGHEAPVFSVDGKKRLREYVEQGGLIFAEACCGRKEFDLGFRALMKEIFPEPEYDLHPLPEEHAVWRAKFELTPDVHPLWGVEHGCRTVVIYSPEDLSCAWNQAEAQPAHAMVEKARRVGLNVVYYATGHELPADRLEVRDVRQIKLEPAKRGALHIGKLRHAGEWNVAPLAIPNLTSMLRSALKFDVVINHKEIYPRDPNLMNFPLIYIHGRAAMSFSDQDMEALRKHINPGGGTLFADAACGSPAFDSAFRRFIVELLPDNPLVPIPRDDEIYTKQVGFDLSKVQYTKAAGGGDDFPQLEGVKIDGHWAIIYSKYDIGCALERQQGGIDCKGYTHESALKIAANIVLYATMP